MQNQKNLSIIAIVIAVLGVIVPIAYDYLSTRSLVQFQLLSEFQLVNKQDSKLEVTYNGEQIESASKLDFLIINNGSRPITDDQIKLAPSVTIANNSKILESKITKYEPDGIVATLSSNTDTISIAFPLLNPNDRVFFSAIVSGSDFTIKTGGRIYGINEIEFWDRTSEEANPRELQLAFYFTTAAALFTLFLFFIAIRERNDVKNVLDNWGDYSGIGIDELKLKVRDSCKPLYNRYQAIRKIEPIFNEIESSDEVDHEASYNKVKNIIDKAATRAAKANTNLAIATITLFWGALYYIGITLLRVYG